MRPDATPDEVRHAYRRKALDAHPDRLVDGAPADSMLAINEAWNVLSDPTRRADYDRTLAPPPAPARPAPPPPAHARSVAVEADAEEPEPVWVDLTPQLRRFRRLLTTILILGTVFALLVFWLIIWPETA